MGKGLGIAALVIMLLSFPVPVVGTWIGYIALLLAAGAALAGHSTLAIATTVVGVVKMYFLSPGLMASMYLPFVKVEGEAAPASAYMFLVLTTVLVALPIVALVARKVLFRGPASS